MPSGFTKRLGLLVLAACGCSFLTSALAAPPAGAPTREELADAAKWVDRLEWPDLRGKAYVELTFGQATQNSKVIEGPKLRGFLLAEDETNWTVFCDGTAPDAGYWAGWRLAALDRPPSQAESRRRAEHPRVDPRPRVAQGGGRSAGGVASARRGTPGCGWIASAPR